MSKLFENKQQLIHIASEIVVMAGIIFYVSQSNKKLMGHVEELTQRLEEQEDILKKHEKILEHLTCSRQPQPVQQLTKREEPAAVVKKKDKVIPNKKDTQRQNAKQTVQQAAARIFNTMLPPSVTTIHMSAPFSVPEETNYSQKIRFADEDKIKEEDEDEEQLDSEIHSELKDLLGIESDDDADATDDDDDDEKSP